MHHAVGEVWPTPHVEGIRPAEQAPQTMQKFDPARPDGSSRLPFFPANFDQYKYAGRAIESLQVLIQKPGDKEPHYEKKRFLVARMERRTQSLDSEGANAVIAMNVSYKDLVAGKHPDAARVKDDLHNFYQNAYTEDGRPKKPASHHRGDRTQLKPSQAGTPNPVQPTGGKPPSTNHIPTRLAAHSADTTDII